MKINVSGIKRETGKSIRAELIHDAAPLTFGGETYQFTAPLQVAVTVTNTGRLLVAEGEVKTELTLKCSRCLEIFTFPVNFTFTGEFAEAGPGTTAGDCNDPPEAGYTYAGDTIDLAPAVYEHLYLALPMKPVCNELCRGLCPQCGRNLNNNPCGCVVQDVDPRLAALKQLMEKKPQKSR